MITVVVLAAFAAGLLAGALVYRARQRADAAGALVIEPGPEDLDRLWLATVEEPVHGPGICGCGEEDAWARGCPAGEYP